VGLGVESRFPATVIAQFVARASGARDQPEAEKADRDENEHHRIH